jgi:RNA polymerase sigma factor (sigma-70 family)
VADTPLDEETAPADEPVTHPAAVPDAAPQDFEALYEEHVPVMIGFAVKRFGISETDAQTLAHEVFLDFILKARRVTNVRAWLIASMRNASRYYVRVRARSEALPDTFDEKPDPQLARVIDMWPEQLAARQAIGCTTARCQLVLGLRYLEGYSVPEIARELNISEKYASKLVFECLEQAKRRYAKMARGAKS